MMVCNCEKDELVCPEELLMVCIKTSPGVGNKEMSGSK